MIYLLIAVAVLTTLSGCSNPLGKGDSIVESLYGPAGDIFQPLIMGGTNVTLTAGSLVFVVSGTCDPKALSTEYSANGGTTWTNLGTCPSGTFSFSVNVFSVLTVQVRSRSATSTTNSSTALITATTPTTNVVFSFATASRSDLANPFAPTLSFTMPNSMTGTQSSVPSSFKLNLHPTGIVYAQ